MSAKVEYESVVEEIALDMENEYVATEAKSHLPPQFRQAEFVKQFFKGGKLHNLFDCGRNVLDVMFRERGSDDWSYAGFDKAAA